MNDWHVPNLDQLTEIIHARQPFSCGPFVRATRNTFAFPSLKDRILDYASQRCRGGHPNFSTAHDFVRALGRVPPLFEGDERTRRLNDPARQKRERKDRDDYNQANELLKTAVLEADTIKTDDYVTAARQWCGELLQQASTQAAVDKTTFEALHPKTSHRSDREPIEHLDDETNRVDLHWKPDNDHYRLRARWELYGHSQNFSIFEDFASKSIIDPEPNDGGIKRFQDHKYGGEGDAKTKYDAFRAFLLKSGKVDADSPDLENDVQDIITDISGDLLTSARYWLIPLNWLLQQSEGQAIERPESLESYVRKYAQWRCGNINNGTLAGCEPPTPFEQERAEQVLRGITQFARDEWFQIRTDKIDIPQSHGTPSYRDDFVFSFVANGRAILISDLRPRRPMAGASYTRTLIIDLGLEPEQRGRLLQRLMDLASFRNLGLRGHPMTNPTIDAITSIGRVLNSTWEASDIIGDPSSAPANESNKARKKRLAELDHQAAQSLDNLRQISWTLDRLNMLFVYGVTGKLKSTLVYSSQVEDILFKLRETRIEGWQTLSDYLDRYFQAASQIERMSNRYNSVRDRLTTATELLNTVFNQRQIDQLNKAADEHSMLMNRAILASTLAALAAILALFPGISDTVSDLIGSIPELFQTAKPKST